MLTHVLILSYFWGTSIVLTICIQMTMLLYGHMSALTNVLILSYKIILVLVSGQMLNQCLSAFV